MAGAGPRRPRESVSNISGRPTAAKIAFEVAAPTIMGLGLGDFFACSPWPRHCGGGRKKTKLSLTAVVPPLFRVLGFECALGLFGAGKCFQTKVSVSCRQLWRRLEKTMAHCRSSLFLGPAGVPVRSARLELARAWAENWTSCLRVSCVCDFWLRDEKVARCGLPLPVRHATPAQRTKRECRFFLLSLGVEDGRSTGQWVQGRPVFRSLHLFRCLAEVGDSIIACAV